MHHSRQRANMVSGAVPFGQIVKILFKRVPFSHVVRQNHVVQVDAPYVQSCLVHGRPQRVLQPVGYFQPSVAAFCLIFGLACNHVKPERCVLIQKLLDSSYVHALGAVVGIAFLNLLHPHRGVFGSVGKARLHYRPHACAVIVAEALHCPLRGFVLVHAESVEIIRHSCKYPWLIFVV